MYELLRDVYSVSIFFYNPNIMPLLEYEKRLNELETFSSFLGADLIIEEPDVKKWSSETLPYKDLGERSERCWACYEHRMMITYQKAKEYGFNTVATSLTISPHKDAVKVNEIGVKLQKEYGIEYLVSDFKKNDGFKKSLEISRKMNFYRQNYCGCIYSKKEREAAVRSRPA